MARFLIRRILQGVFVVVVATIVVYWMFTVGPGPEAVAHKIAGKQATAATIQRVLVDYRLNKPFYNQYWHFLARMIHGNFGQDYYHGQSVNSILKQAFPVTLSLTIGSSILWFVGGVSTGVISAVRRGTIWDRSATSIAIVLYSAPVFVIGLVLLYINLQFTKHGVRWFPGQGYVYFTASPWHWFRSLVLPWIALACISAATYTRLTRGSMLDVMGEDYIRTARSKGLHERRVVYRHTLRSAMTPVISQFGIDVGTLLGGAILTEVTFGLPGLGYEAYQSAEVQDLPVILGIVVIATVAVVLANIIVDAFYAVLDPRVRLH